MFASPPRAMVLERNQGANTLPDGRSIPDRDWWTKDQGRLSLNNLGHIGHRGWGLEQTLIGPVLRLVEHRRHSPQVFALTNTTNPPASRSWSELGAAPLVEKVALSTIDKALASLKDESLRHAFQAGRYEIRRAFGDPEAQVDLDEAINALPDGHQFRVRLERRRDLNRAQTA